MEKKAHPIRRRVTMILSSLLLVVAVVLSTLGVAYASTLDNYFTRRNIDVTDEHKKEVYAKNTELAKEIEGEGLVLLQNNDATLPLSDSVKKVNVFGWASTQWLGGGSGSGQCIGVNTDLLTALTNYGVSYNESLTNMYKDFQSEREFADTLHSAPNESCILYEPSINDSSLYTKDILDKALNYSDTAIVVFGRLSGESNDCTRTQFKRTTKNGDIVEDKDRTYLDLSKEEEDLLTYVAGNYENVIVLLNTGNVMALGPIESIEGVDSCMMVGLTGTNAAAAIPEAIWGEINPSGKTADTWAYDFATAASYANTSGDGVGFYSNADGLYPNIGITNGNMGAPYEYKEVPYVDYTEGIYIGYKWYETADVEGFFADVANDFGEGYDAVVQYPFGYGLSYTSFKQEIVEHSTELASDGTVSVKVKVTNTGDVPGKDVVELYYSAPYLSGEIEKSAVELGAFGKTDILNPGDSQEIQLSFDVEDMASYDCYDANKNGFKGYELDGGDYVFSIRSDSHNVIDEFSLNLADNVKYEVDSKTGNTVSNKFTGEDAVDGVSVDGSDADQNITYLSRADFAGTFPTENIEGRKLGEKAAKINLYTEDMANAWIDENAEDVTTGKDNNLLIEKNGKLTKLGKELGANYDSEKWDELLDQMTLEEMENLTLHGYCHTAAVDSIGKPSTIDADGPAQYGSFGLLLFGLLDVTSYEDTCFPNEGVIAQTWNVELANQMGYAAGEEAGLIGATGWYAPATNMHRSPFNGRNYEYYSEDSVLSGQMCGNTIQGAKNAGVFCFVKHMVCNDGESGIFRDSVYLWMTEQALRETYLKPFRTIVEDYDATGIMSSYNRIGAVWTGGSEALLTSVLRDEWGFKGAVITDYSDHHEYMNGDQMIRAGGDLWMDGFDGSSTLAFETESNSIRNALRRGSKNIIYMYLNARTTNLEYAGDDASLVKPNIHVTFPIWKVLIVAVDIVAIILFALTLRALLKDRKLRADN
ncbi:glycoside hydrolase family 3 N-terminal domain-containing protein [Pseudobutyrivibrio sp.]